MVAGTGQTKFAVEFKMREKFSRRRGELSVVNNIFY